MQQKKDKVCPNCGMNFALINSEQSPPPKFCPYCSKLLEPLKSTYPGLENSGSGESITLIPDHALLADKIEFTIGPYQVLQSIGKGGMGEVFLAYDTNCGRKIALKRIRTDLVEHIQLHNRFLKEARITSQLTHPAIIPIYAIDSEHSSEHNLAYYTMPFVEGDTLKQILREARKRERKGEKIDSASSIPALIRIFLSVCQAVAYAHSKNVLHRDLKPENIIVGPFGEVLILDWGLAKLIKSGLSDNEASTESDAEETPQKHSLYHLTNLGKVVGTISYMAPERALGMHANYQTDVYSLGVILYQILTLRHPFKRGSLKEFRENVSKEILIDPVEVAPYRDVPRVLARIALKSLAAQAELRYPSVNELIHDIQAYIEGRSEWFLMGELNIQNKPDWEFQENVLIAEHIAITRSTEVSDWVSLMISKSSFSGNTKIEAKVRIGEKGHGLGFLLSVPEVAERVHLNDGYCLWLGSDINKATKLLRSTVEVMNMPDLVLYRHEWYHVRIEMIDNNIYFYLNDVLQLSYISHLPLTGTHVGLLARDDNFEISPISVSVGSQNIMIKCLAVPDAFLAHKDYFTALSEYRRIGYAFPGTAEGREAMFRAGITLLEHARNSKNAEANHLYELALEEFGKLHHTPGAPLEYLGKALVYQTLRDYDEEIKCFELAFRRYPHHPLLPVLQEHVAYRLHESSRFHRKAAYSFVLLVLRYLPLLTTSNHIKKLFSSLEKHWEILKFIVDPTVPIEEKIRNKLSSIQVAFWLAKPYVLAEIIDELLKSKPLDGDVLTNALFCLIELGSWKLAEIKFKEAKQNELLPPINKGLELIDIAITTHSQSIQFAMEVFFQQKRSDLRKEEQRIVLHLIDCALKKQNLALVHEIINKTADYDLAPELAQQINIYKIWVFLLEKNWEKAGELLHTYPLEELSQENSLLHFLYGCWLYATEGKDIAYIHFSGVLDVSYPRTWSLGTHFLIGKIGDRQGWLDKAFVWEKRQLYQQLSLYYHCAGDAAQVQYYQNLEENEYIHVEK